MELPKNITQIGEVGGTCKIYVEDYVVSYMKQLNEVAGDKEMAVALYGKCTEEDGVRYYFLYGACKLDFLQQEVRHLSQAQHQEIEKLRTRHFPEYQFLGYRHLNGEMIEGFHICEQDICRYIEGYFQFYEKNDSMLNYMLMVRPEAAPELFDQGKYEEVKQRQEERRAESFFKERGVSWAKKKAESLTNLQKMRFASVVVFALLCLAGIASIQRNSAGSTGKDLLEDAQPVFAPGVRTEADMPSQTASADDRAAGDRLVMEDRLEQALLQENQAVTDAGMENAQQESTQSNAALSEAAQLEELKPVTTPVPEATTAPTPAPEATTAPTPAPTVVPTAAPTSSPAVTETVSKTGAVAYIVRKGDTLIGISMRQYGVDTRVSDICSLNNISNPDDIKQGQILMLPK